MANLVAHLAADLRTQPADWIAEVVAKILFRRRMRPGAGVFTSPPSAIDPGGDSGADGGGGNQGDPPSGDGGGEQVYSDITQHFRAAAAASSSSAAITSQLSTVGPA